MLLVAVALLTFDDGAAYRLNSGPAFESGGVTFVDRKPPCPINSRGFRE